MRAPAMCFLNLEKESWMSSAKSHSFNIPIKILAWVLNGIALKLLWGWFVVPVFGIPVLELWSSTGIGIVVRYLTSQQIPREDKEINDAFFYSIYNPALAVAFGYIVYRLANHPVTQIHF